MAHRSLQQVKAHLILGETPLFEAQSQLYEVEESDENCQELNKIIDSKKMQEHRTLAGVAVFKSKLKENTLTYIVRVHMDCTTNFKTVGLNCRIPNSELLEIGRNRKVYKQSWFGWGNQTQNLQPIIMVRKEAGLTRENQTQNLQPIVLVEKQLVGWGNKLKIYNQ